MNIVRCMIAVAMIATGCEFRIRIDSDPISPASPAPVAKPTRRADPPKKPARPAEFPINACSCGCGWNVRGCHVDGNGRYHAECIWPCTCNSTDADVNLPGSG
jgi:hypothetical protein